MAELKSNGPELAERSVTADTVSSDSAEAVAATATATATATAAGQQSRTLRQRVLAVVWDSLDKSPEDRRLIAKLDWFILSYVCVAYFVKYLDQTNVSNAYVSGMKEDLHLHGNDLNLLTTYWTIGYIIGQVPSQLVLTRVPARLWLPSLELVWSVLVIAMSGARTKQAVFGLRFAVGLLEASAYPGIMTLLGNWYQPEELAKRACIYQASSSVAQMFSGYLQAGLYAHMDGVHGRAAWRWLFIFDGIIGVPIALYGFFAVPDSPATTTARWLSPAERQRCISRMAAVGRSSAVSGGSSSSSNSSSPTASGRRQFTLRSLVNLFREWPVYLFTASFVCYIQATRVYAYFNVWLKSTHRYSVEQVNEIPTAGFGLLVVCTLLGAWTSDALQARWPVIVFFASVSLIGAIVLSVSVHRPAADANVPAIIAGFLLTYVTTATAGIYMTYMTEIFSYNGLHRAVAIALADTVAYVFVAWLPLVIFDTADAPYFRVGYKVTAVFLALQVVFICMVPLAHRRWPVGQYEDDVRGRGQVDVDAEQQRQHHDDDTAEAAEVAEIASAEVLAEKSPRYD